MIRIMRIQVTCLFIWMGISGFALAQVPQLMNYQGLLVDPATGEPVADDTYEMVFSIYDLSTGGSAVWTESKSVQTQNGLYSVLLGSTTPLTATVLSGSEKYLGIKVDTDAEMTPRKRIVSAAYAIMSEEAENSWRLTGNSGTAAGTNFIGTTDSEPLVFKINGAEAMRINATGNVGIGTTNPSQELHVYKSGGIADVRVESSESSLIDFGSGPNGHFIYGYGDYDLRFATNGTEKMRLTSSGRIGIGTTSPGEELHLEGNEYITGYINGPVASNFNQVILGKGNVGTGLVLNDIANAKYRIHTGGFNLAFDQDQSGTWTPRMAIKNGGNVGIGTTSPEKLLHLYGGDDPTLKIQSDGGQEISGRVSLRQSNDTGMDIYYDGRGNFDGLAFESFSSGNSLGVKMYIDGFGEVGIGTSSPTNILTVKQNSNTDPIADAWTTYSSKRWKTNIKPIDGALDKVKGLRGVSYDWKADGKHDIGLIAEEVGEVIPEVVAYEDNGTDAKSVNYARLVAVLIEAVKAQQKQLEKQQKTMDGLVERLTILEKQSHRMAPRRFSNTVKTTDR